MHSIGAISKVTSTLPENKTMSGNVRRSFEASEAGAQAMWGSEGGPAMWGSEGVRPAISEKTLLSITV